MFQRGRRLTSVQIQRGAQDLVLRQQGSSRWSEESVDAVRFLFHISCSAHREVVSPADDQEAYAPPPGPPPPGRSPAPVQSNNDPSRAGQSPSYYSSNSQQPAYNGQNSPSYSGQPSYNAPSPVPGQKGLGGLLSKLTGHNQQQGYPQQYGGGGGYPQQQAYGGYPQQQYGGYPQQAGYGGQQRHSGLGAGGGVSASNSH